MTRRLPATVPAHVAASGDTARGAASPRWRLPAPALLILACALLLAPARAHAQGDIRVIDSGARGDFPTAIAFSLDAEAPAGVTDVSLQVNVTSQRYGAFPRNVRPDFMPGTRVRASWTWRRYGGGLPPGSEIRYRWTVTDGTGAVVETNPATVRVDDTRFEWRELKDGPLTVRWHQGGDGFGRDVLASATRAIAELSQEQGVDLQTPVTVHVYASANELSGALPGLPAWAGGVSLGEYDALLVPIAPNDLTRGRKALAHELTHQLIYQITFNQALGSRVPAWLNEGLAVVSEGATSQANRRALDDAIDADHVPTLRSLGGAAFSGIQDPHRAELAYAVSESVVRYLIAREGPAKMRALLAEFREGLNPDDALRRALGKGVDEVEDGWRTSLGLRPLDRGGSAGPADQRPAAPAAAARRTDGNRPLVLTAAGLLAVALLGAAAGGVVLWRRRA